METSQKQWLLALVLGVVVVGIVWYTNQPVDEQAGDSRQITQVAVEQGEETPGAQSGVAKPGEAGLGTTNSGELPSVDALQAMPTPAPALLISFNGAQPELSASSIPVGSVLQFANNSPEPVVLAFSSGARMTVGAEGTAEYTVFKPGQEIVDVETATDLYQLALTVQQP